MDKRKQKILVTGAAGHIGQELIKMLVRRSFQYEITVFDLNTPKNREFFDRFSETITICYGDITDPSSLTKATQDQDIVFHLASVIPPTAHENPELAKRVNIQGTENLIASLEKNSPNAFIVMTSSVAVYGDRLLNPYINVGDPLIPVEDDNYATDKIEMEELVRSSKLSWTIYRLSAIMGTGNHYSPEMMFKMPLEQVLEICTPKDTARALLHTIEHTDEVCKKIFNLGGGPSCTTTYGDFLSRNFEIYGLGLLDFPQHAFATKNGHCGYYEDGDRLNEILDFRRDTIEDYYKTLKAKTPRLQRWATRGMAKMVKSYLLSKSEPYHAWITGNKELKEKYFR